MNQAQVRLAEQMITRMACAWQGARCLDLGMAKLLQMPQGGSNILTEVQAQPGEQLNLAHLAAQQHAYVVVTPASTPSGLGRFLQSHAFRARRPSLVLGAAADQGRDLSRPGIQVEEVREEALDAWHRVFAAAFATPTQDPQYSEEASRQAFGRLGGQARWFLGLLAAQPVGCAVLYSWAGMGLLMAVGTIPSARRQGVAATVVSRAFQAWAQQGGSWIFLETNTDNVARKLYRQAGFRLAYRRTLYAADYALTGHWPPAAQYGQKT